MQYFKVSEPVGDSNYAVKAEWSLNGESLIRSAFFGSAKEFAEWLDAFDYETGDIFGWQGDSATMKAIESFRNDSDVIAVPEFITEYNVNDGTTEIIGADQFHMLRRMFQRDPDYIVFRHFADGAKVHSVMYRGNGAEKLSSYVWHVPFGADDVYA